MEKRALFLDRDGTLVRPRHYPSRPADLVLYERIGPPLVRLQQLGFGIVVITNQAGLAHGRFDARALDLMHAHLTAELRALGVRLDAIYHCPHHPDGRVPGLAVRCDCRKPAPGLLLRAAAEHGYSPAQSWMVGDILDDVEAGSRAGCRTVLVDTGGETEWLPGPFRTPTFVAPNTVRALERIVAVTDAEAAGAQTAVAGAAS